MSKVRITDAVLGAGSKFGEEVLMSDLTVLQAAVLFFALGLAVGGVTTELIIVRYYHKRLQRLREAAK